MYSTSKSISLSGVNSLRTAEPNTDSRRIGWLAQYSRILSSGRSTQTLLLIAFSPSLSQIISRFCPISKGGGSWLVFNSIEFGCHRDYFVSIKFGTPYLFKRRFLSLAKTIDDPRAFDNFIANILAQSVIRTQVNGALYDFAKLSHTSRHCKWPDGSVRQVLCEQIHVALRR